MARTKRSKVVKLTAVKKKGKDSKAALLGKVSDLPHKFKFVYVVRLCNERNVHLKELREKLRPGIFVFGKNRIIQKALGVSPETEIADDMHKIALQMKGARGLLFTDLPPAQVQEHFDFEHPAEFARSGFCATDTIILKEGADSLKAFPQSVESHLRKLGLPTLLKNGVIHLLGEYTVCTEGKEINSSQAQLLKLLGIRMAEFRMEMMCSWHDGVYTQIAADAVVVADEGMN
eukprot:GHVS01031203.1.p1 GENE.GHVS01031203.1~~GHVS01031203.1.p1  ORF type:complete len:232 (+),score=42.16 GHVS01031203.1:168-863(+)